MGTGSGKSGIQKRQKHLGGWKQITGCDNKEALSQLGIFSQAIFFNLLAPSNSPILPPMTLSVKGTNQVTAAEP